MQKPVLSVVATIYRAEKTVSPLVAEIVRYIEPLNVPYELLLVNDNSPDGSEREISNECKKNPSVKGISLSRNFGQQIAMSAGIKHATGDYVLIMDGDLQNPPSEIPNLFNKIREGYDIIYCVSKSRNNLLDGFTSALFWFILVRLMKVNIIKNQLMMKIMTGAFVEEYNEYGEQNRTVDGIANNIGQNSIVVEIQNQKRHSGKSNYTFIKRFNLMVDMIISLSTAPLNFLIHLGWVIFSLTIIVSFYYLYLYVFYNVPAGYTSLMLSIFFFGSLIILMLGIIGRYLANIYLEVRNRPLYHVRKKINF